MQFLRTLSILGLALIAVSQAAPTPQQTAPVVAAPTVAPTTPSLPSSVDVDSITKKLLEAMKQNPGWETVADAESD